MRRRSGRPALARRGRRRRPRPHQRREHAPETRGQNDRQEQHGQPELDERDSVQGRERRLAEHEISRGPEDRKRADPDHLRESVENPDDDAVRLIFADWLEERDDPRGEFIRIQVRRDRPGLDEARETQLLGANIAYKKAAIALQRTTGALLDENSIVVEQALGVK